MYIDDIKQLAPKEITEVHSRCLRQIEGLLEYQPILEVINANRQAQLVHHELESDLSPFHSLAPVVRVPLDSRGTHRGIKKIPFFSDSRDAVP